MFVEFSVSNFRSIKKIETISFVAAPIVSKDKEIDNNNTFVAPGGKKLLKSLAIYGANGSGKSNILKALYAMLVIVRDSFADEKAIDNMSDPFVLDKRSKALPTFFQLVVIINKNQYRYGFEIKKGKVISEWLFGPAQVNEVFYFEREKDGIRVNTNSFAEGKDLESRTKDTTLFLNVTHAFDGKIASTIKDYFNSKILIHGGIGDEQAKKWAIDLMDDNEIYADVMKLLKNADFGIEKIYKEEVPVFNKAQNKEAEKKRITFRAHRSVLNSKGEAVELVDVPFDYFESEGTKKLFFIAASYVHALKVGRTLFIDEFEARLHPLLTRHILKMFNSKEHNKNNAQLVFATHDVGLLDSSILRRDQVYFVEKNKLGVSHFYSLINIGGVRNDASYGKDYIKGKYGAVPYLRNSHFE
jgi:AAA15 family ATPase/GTPase